MRELNEQLHSMRTSPNHHLSSSQDVFVIDKENQLLKEKFAQVFNENKDLKQQLDDSIDNVRKLEWALLQSKRSEVGNNIQ